MHKFATKSYLVYNIDMSLKQIFEPESIAVIGASDEAFSVGNTIFQNLKKSGVKLYPVNPKHETIGGQKSYKSILEITEPVDLAIIIVPAKFCITVINEITQTKCRAVILISAGFKEIGGEGLSMEHELKNICLDSNMTLIGPNCLGVLNPILDFNMSFAASIPPKGNIALVSQSGAICTAIIDSAQHLGLGFSKFISTGNKAIVDETELIEYLNEDQDTKVIAIYCENLVNATKFIEVCQKSTKPIIVLKSGKSMAGALSASSHTGALASDANLYEALFRQAGVIEVDSIQEMLETMQVLSHNLLVNLKNIAIITNAGGPGVLATDAVSNCGLGLAHFSEPTVNELQKVLPPTANFHNPIDLIGDATSQRYRESIGIIMNNTEVDGVVILLTPQSMTDVENVGQIILDAKQKYQKPIVVSMMGFDKTNSTVNYLRQNSVAVIDFPESAVRALSKVKNYEINKTTVHKQNFIKVSSEKLEIVKLVLDSGNGRKYIPENEAKRILECYELPIVHSYLAKTVKEAVDYAEKLNSNVVLKVISHDIFHKTDIGGVMINLGLSEVEYSYNLILDNVKKNAPLAKIDGILVSEYVDFKTQNQFVLGVKKDPNLGHAIMFGLGGIFVEVFKDTTFGFVPIEDPEIDRMLEELKSKQFLFGVRGLPPLDIPSLKKTILNLARLITDFPNITEIDMNPIVVLEKGVKILDVKIIVE